MRQKIGLCVPTLNAGDRWGEWLEALKRQSVYPDFVLVIDSGSQDSTAEMAESSGQHVVRIERSSFNHGATRQLAVSMMDDADIVLFLTQDAIFSSNDAIKEIIKPFDITSVAAVCGRQLPRQNALPLESHARTYNYPAHSFCRCLADSKKFGLKTAFISNSFSAYRVSSLMEIGGFPHNVIFGEDMYVAAKLLQAGYEIAYTADACVYHSHDYSLLQEFRRYFDMGVFHAREPWLRSELGSAEGEGVKFVRSEIYYLLKNAFWLIPEGVLRTVLRYGGFRAGLMEGYLPCWFKRKLAMNRSYFT